MSDIVERVRGVDETSVEECFLMSYLFTAAADEIERLRKRVAELESAPDWLCEAALDSIDPYWRVVIFKLRLECDRKNAYERHIIETRAALVEAMKEGKDD
jgi:hypothetical protein